MKGRKEYLLVASDKHICIHYLVSLLTDALHARDRHREGESERKGQIGLTRARIDGKVWICGQASRQWHGTRRFAGMLPLTHLDLIFMGAGRCYGGTEADAGAATTSIFSSAPLSPSLSRVAGNQC